MYQSGCAAVLTAAGSNGPYSQTGLICASPPSSASTPAIEREQADALRGVGRPQPRADDVVLAPAAAAELRVLLPPQDREVGAEQRRDRDRDDAGCG